MWRKSYLFLFLAPFVLILLNCGPEGGDYPAPATRSVEDMTPEEAREKLREKGIEFGQYAFMFNVRDGNTRMVKLFLKAGMDPDTEDIKNLLHGAPVEKTPLMYAVKTSSPEISIALIKAGAEVNTVGRGGMTPLMYAALRGNSTVVTVLLSAGAEVNAQTRAGWTPLLHAVVGGTPMSPHGGLADMLLDAATGLNAAVEGKIEPRRGGRSQSRPATPGAIESVRTLIDAGADTNARMANGETPLMFASRLGRTEMVQMLLASRADPTHKNMIGDTALILAKRYNHDDIVQILESVGVRE